MVEQGGLQPGGLNFDAKVRRESTDVEDLFIAHVAAMDAFARGLRNSARIVDDGILAAMVKVYDTRTIVAGEGPDQTIIQ